MTIDINELRKDKRPQSSIVVQALLDRLETAENDAAHQKALAASALRVAEGWERKCGELRAKIEAMEKQVPICRAEDLRHAEILLPSLGLMPEDKLYALPGAKGWDPAMQDALMKFDPATGEERPYPSHANQWRNWHGTAAWLFDPWTGKRRNAYDVCSDVHGLLIAPAGTLGMDMGGGCATTTRASDAARSDARSGACGRPPRLEESK